MESKLNEVYMSFTYGDIIDILEGYDDWDEMSEEDKLEALECNRNHLNSTDCIKDDVLGLILDF